MGKRKFRIGDLVTLRKDLLGIPGFSGIVLDIVTESDQCMIKVYWIDGATWLEFPDTIRIIARARR